LLAPDGTMLDGLRPPGWPVSLPVALALFVVTALAEILGCWLVWLWLRQGGSVWLLSLAALSLAVFAGLLSLHPAASGRVYAAYGGIYVLSAVGWLWLVDGVRPTRWDVAGVLLMLAGSATIILGHWREGRGGGEGATGIPSAGAGGAETTGPRAEP
jgi:small multidrug resistance family-3 protein